MIFQQPLRVRTLPGKPNQGIMSSHVRKIPNSKILRTCKSRLLWTTMSANPKCEGPCGGREERRRRERESDGGDEEGRKGDEERKRRDQRPYCGALGIITNETLYSLACRVHMENKCEGYLCQTAQFARQTVTAKAKRAAQTSFL